VLTWPRGPSRPSARGRSYRYSCVERPSVGLFICKSPVQLNGTFGQVQYMGYHKLRIVAVAAGLTDTSGSNSE
jgi:hypothetical protein